jgi:hypothetical protein
VKGRRRKGERRRGRRKGWEYKEGKECEVGKRKEVFCEIILQEIRHQP